MSDLHTPESVAGLEEAIRCDLASVSAAIGVGAGLLDGLWESLRVLPSSQSRIKAWRDQLGHILGQIAEEQADVTRKLLGTEQPPIEQRTDEAHTAQVLALKREA